ncbi:MAG: hypothetical protein ABL933_09445 [Methyloglobulus sp.]|nr:hypothetical protein [Methyloglobulus sp.]
MKLYELGYLPKPFIIGKQGKSPNAYWLKSDIESAILKLSGKRGDINVGGKLEFVTKATKFQAGKYTANICDRVIRIVKAW